MMFWEIIATVFSGFLLAGLVLPIRLFYKRAPKWIVPVAAGIGMLGFQIFSEYTWANDTITKLPKESVVVAKAPTTTWYRPWSYAFPQVLQFVALDTSSVIAHPDKPNLKKANLYFFERRQPVHTLGIEVDCQAPITDFEKTADKAMAQEINKNLCKK